MTAAILINFSRSGRFFPWLGPACMAKNKRGRLARHKARTAAPAPPRRGWAILLSYSITTRRVTLRPVPVRRNM